MNRFGTLASMLLLPMLLGPPSAVRIDASAGTEDTPRAATEAPAPVSYAIVGADVLPMTGRGRLTDQTLLVRGDTIAVLGPADEVEVPPGATEIAADGLFVTPGLVDVHVHLRHADPAALQRYLRAGITTVREMNGRPHLLALRERIRAGETAGPEMVVASPTLGNFSSPREGYPTPETTAEGKAAVRGFHDQGYAWIKVYSFLPAEGFAGVIHEAERLGIPVGGHVPLAVGLPAVLDSGIRSIEHLTEYVGTCLTEESRELDARDQRSVFGAGDLDSACLERLVERTVAAGVWNVPTLVWFDRILAVDMARDAWRQPALRAQGRANRREIVRRLHEAGAKLAVGTDSDAGDDLPAAAIHDELDALLEAGLSTHEALSAATVGGAGLLGLRERIGTLAEGMRADLLILHCDPIEDLRCLRDPRIVMARGELVVD